MALSKADRFGGSENESLIQFGCIRVIKTMTIVQLEGERGGQKGVVVSLCRSFLRVASGRNHYVWDGDMFALHLHGYERPKRRRRRRLRWASQV